MAGLESNKRLVKMLRGAVSDFEEQIRNEMLPAKGAALDELKSNMYEFYLGDGATEAAGGNESGARKLFFKYLDEFLAQERAKAGGGEAPAAGGPARYEVKEGSSSKFWEIALDGKSFKATWGRIGTPGTSQVKKFKDAATAKKEHDKLVAEKTKKGYRPTGSKGAGKAKKNGKAAEPATKAASNPSLEAAIRKDPDDADAFLVYADWLQTQGDPRGELATIQHGLLKKPKDAALKKASAKLLKAHAAHFYGSSADLVDDDREADVLTDVVWHLGFLKSVKIANCYARDPDFSGPEGEKPRRSVKIPEVLAGILDHPSGKFLRELTLGIVTMSDNSYTACFKVLAREPRPLLRKLFAGDFDSEETELNWSSIGKAGDLWAALPNLEELTLRSGDTMDLGTISLPSLRSFHVITGGLPKKALAAIQSAHWPKLERLVVQLGSDVNFKISDLQPILDGKGLARVIELGLTNTVLSDAICKALPSSKIAGQLEVLDLSLGTMSDEGALALAAGKKAFKRLKVFVAAECYIGKKGKAALRGFCKDVDLADQREDESDPEDRYIASYE